MILDIKKDYCSLHSACFNFLSNFYALIRLFSNSTGTFLSLTANPEFITKPRHRTQINYLVKSVKKNFPFIN